MSYSRKVCRDILTSQQREKALATLVNLRSELILSQLTSVTWVDIDYSGFELGAYHFSFSSLSQAILTTTPVHMPHLQHAAASSPNGYRPEAPAA